MPRLARVAASFFTQSLNRQTKEPERVYIYHTLHHLYPIGIFNTNCRRTDCDVHSYAKNGYGYNCNNFGKTHTYLMGYTNV